MPSVEHNELSAKALTWLGYRATGKGIRGACEVFLGDGYVADAIAFFSPQYRYLEEYCRPAGIDPAKHLAYWLCVFEAKVSRADFLSTFGPTPGDHVNRHRPVGHMHWCVTPRGLIDPAELPLFWGLLEQSGGGLREVRMPAISSIPEPAMDHIAHILIWKPDPFLRAPGDVGSQLGQRS
jgi:hypothetical protein